MARKPRPPRPPSYSFKTGGLKTDKPKTKAVPHFTEGDAGPQPPQSITITIGSATIRCDIRYKATPPQPPAVVISIASATIKADVKYNTGPPPRPAAITPGATTIKVDCHG